MAALQEETNINEAQEADEKSGDGLSLGVHETKDGRVKVSVLAPTLQKGQDRLPVILCCVVDTSGSMQLSAKIKDASGNVESTGITVLQLVKHSIKTIIHCLNDSDYLSIVAYSSKAKVVTQMMAMTEQNKKTTLAKLDELQPDGQTNLWDGLQNGLELMRTNKDLKASEKNSAILLFTDGLPNVTPPKGELGMLDKYVDTYGLPSAIHTYGFGYQLDTKLLNALAQRASGTFAFIPDSSMVGTIFVNSLSNISSNVAKNVVLSVTTNHKTHDVKVLGNYQHQTTTWGVQITLGNVMYQQNKDVVLQFTAKDEAKDNDQGPEEVMDGVEGQMDAIAITPSKMYEVGTESLTYISLRTGNVVNGAVQCFDDDKNGKSTDMNTYRLKSCDVMNECMTDAQIKNLDAAQSKLRALIAEIKGNANVAKEKFISDLLEDLTGQVFEAVSSAQYYKKWGRHYIPSLVNAHLHQYCNNFKDPGVQNYGGALFAKLKETGNEVFIKLPPPKVEAFKSPYSAPQGGLMSFSSYGGASHAMGNGGYGGAANGMMGGGMGGGGPWKGGKAKKGKAQKAKAKRVDMNKYYNVGGGCFHGDGQVLMMDGTTKLVRELKVNDVVSGGAAVRCVVKHECTDNKMRLCVYNGLVITGYHPIRVDGAWTFPIDVDQGHLNEYDCDFVFNFVLDSGHILTVNGVEACTLGHGFKSSAVIEHAYFGTTKITDDLSKLNGWTEGEVTLPVGAFKRNLESHMVEGLVV